MNEKFIITNLKLNPEKYDSTLDLIKKSFQYSPLEKVEIDFYPLLNKNNSNNLWIVFFENKIVAHMGVKIYNIEINKMIFSIAAIGLICTDQEFQNKGIMKKLFSHVFNTYTDESFFILWSDQIAIYEKFDFHPCLEVFHHSLSIPAKQSSLFKPVILSELNNDDFRQINNLYKKNINEIHISRSDDHWEDLKHITSSTFFIRRDINGTIKSYFIKNKGQDLTNIIHEYRISDATEIDEIRRFGELWSSEEFSDDAHVIFGGLIKINNRYQFSQLISQLTNQIIKIEKIDRTLIHFSMDDLTFSTSHQEFLQGIFGPGRYDELGNIPRLFINGLDSI
jgi:hypothetical protein